MFEKVEVGRGYKITIHVKGSYKQFWSWNKKLSKIVAYMDSQIADNDLVLGAFRAIDIYYFTAWIFYTIPPVSCERNVIQ